MEDFTKAIKCTGCDRVLGFSEFEFEGILNCAFCVHKVGSTVQTFPRRGDVLYIPKEFLEDERKFTAVFRTTEPIGNGLPCRIVRGTFEPMVRVWENGMYGVRTNNFSTDWAFTCECFDRTRPQITRSRGSSAATTTVSRRRSIVPERHAQEQRKADEELL